MGYVLSAGRLVIVRWLPRDHQVRDLNHHGLAVLVQRGVADAHDTCAGFDRDGRTSRISDSTQDIARRHRAGPSHLLDPGPDQAAGDPEVALDHQVHRDRSGMPAARHEAAEHAICAGGGVEVKWLRVELRGE